MITPVRMIFWCNQPRVAQLSDFHKTVILKRNLKVSEACSTASCVMGYEPSQPVPDGHVANRPGWQTSHPLQVMKVYICNTF